MRIFKTTKARDITIYIICAIIFSISVATICVVLWPREEATEQPKNTSSSTTSSTKNSLNELLNPGGDSAVQTCLSNAASIGPTNEEIDASENNYTLMVASATKTLQMMDAKIKCYEDAGANQYTNEISELRTKKTEIEQLLSGYQSYNSQTYTYSEPTATTPTYNVPDYAPTPTPTPTCADYHAQYYATYQSELSSTNSHYTSAINSAAANCKSFGGCPQKTSLEQQWQLAVAQLQNSYKSSMTNAGCNPSEYVNF